MSLIKDVVLVCEVMEKKLKAKNSEKDNLQE